METLLLRPLIPLIRWAAALAAALPLWAAAEPLSALDAQVALHRGALAWDVRGVREAAAGELPSALRIDAAALDRWLETADVAALAQAVSAAGIDLSREVVIYGNAGDRRAQALVASLRNVATGAVHWLVGGAPEWQMRGLPVSSAGVARRWPVPQHLVRHGERPTDPACAGGLRNIGDAAQTHELRAGLTL